MNIKNKLKKNDSLRRIVKKIKIYREYLGDAKDFSENYLEVAESQGFYEYRLMLLIHNLEKGMCRNNPRPFGKEKVDQIVKILLACNNHNSFEYHLACETLSAWKNYYEEMQWDISGITQESEMFLHHLESPITKAGRELFLLPKQQIENKQFDDVLLTRRSVRDYLNIPLKSEDVEFAVKCFIYAPTACNRQMCKLYQISDE